MKKGKEEKKKKLTSGAGASRSHGRGGHEMLEEVTITPDAGASQSQGGGQGGLQTEHKAPKKGNKFLKKGLPSGTCTCARERWHRGMSGGMNQSHGEGGHELQVLKRKRT